eukprot:Protomagalhaensia_wolfi_Nauph_80__2223@NODE_2442_length_1091_cov_10_532319_g1913_i0_p1_GENE_NODE_2442_length_1091_cov_10_532319_g1913_i0NODE_2442_length_1091_cov_10_532319_g1913_i0_p1_ORF_typecomplete_len261_score36_66_NODE_2442_length_1091_cov_10_532319_g1913_i0202984
MKFLLLSHSAYLLSAGHGVETTLTTTLALLPCPSICPPYLLQIPFQPSSLKSCQDLLKTDDAYPQCYLQITPAFRGTEYSIKHHQDIQQEQGGSIANIHLAPIQQLLAMTDGTFSYAGVKVILPQPASNNCKYYRIPANAHNKCSLSQPDFINVESILVAPGTKSFDVEFDPNQTHTCLYSTCSKDSTGDLTQAMVAYDNIWYSFYLSGKGAPAPALNQIVSNRARQERAISPTTIPNTASLNLIAIEATFATLLLGFCL